MISRLNPLSYAPYLEAVAAERLSRDAAAIGVTEQIAGFNAVPLTLWHLIVLRIMHHPILTRDGVPSPKQLAQFLWLVAPEFSPGNVKGRKRLVRKCAKLFYPPRYLALLNTRKARLRHEIKRLRRMANAAKILEAARAYIAESLQDQPPTTSANGFRPDYYSDAIAFDDKLAREFSWPPNTALHMPLKTLFQRLNEMKHANGSRTPLCNPSDAVKAQFYRELNQSLAQSRVDTNTKMKARTEELRAAWLAKTNLKKPRWQPKKKS